jgi:hypothetical protein
MSRPCLTTAHAYKDDVMLTLEVRSQCINLVRGANTRCKQLLCPNPYTTG